MNQDEQRQKVVAEALSWVGTPFRDQADSKGRGGGVDCAMLLVRAYVDSGVLPPFDPRPYNSRFFLHRDDEDYLGWLKKYGQEIPEDLAGPGDVVIFHIGRMYAHGALIVNDQLIVHAWFKERMCALSERWAAELNYERHGEPRLRKFYTMWPTS